MRTLFLALSLSAIPAIGANVYTFTVSPAENVSGPPGAPLITGWGYSIHNESASQWLVTTALTAGTFVHATPQLLFEFPDIAPGATVDVPYDPAPPGSGLYQIVWDLNAPNNFINSGTFSLSAQWWTGDPTNGGTLIGTAPNAKQPYSAASTATPEPAALGLVGMVLLAIPLRKLRRRS